MTFITSSITNANPGPTLYTAIETAALALGFTLDDTVVIGGNTHKLLKSAAAGNTYGLDWWLDINYPTTGTTGGIRFAPFEGYTAATDVGLRGPYSANASTIDATTYSRFGATTSALETNWANSASFSALSTALTTSAFAYYVSITRDRIIVGLSNVPGSLAYAGFFTPSSAHSTNAGAALFPLVMAVLASSNAGASSNTTAGSVTAAFTRIPKASSINWGTHARIPINDLASAGVVSGQIGTAASEFTGQSTLQPIPLIMGSATAATTTPLASGVGVLDGVQAGFVSATAARGDTVTIGSDTWYAASPSSSFTIFMKGV
jgi:hypothetical protein